MPLHRIGCSPRAPHASRVRAAFDNAACSGGGRIGKRPHDLAAASGGSTATGDPSAAASSAAAAAPAAAAVLFFFFAPCRWIEINCVGFRYAERCWRQVLNRGGSRRGVARSYGRAAQRGRRRRVARRRGHRRKNAVGRAASQQHRGSIHCGRGSKSPQRLWIQPCYTSGKPSSSGSQHPLGGCSPVAASLYHYLVCLLQSVFVSSSHFHGLASAC